MKLSVIPNSLTLLRLFLIVPIVHAIWHLQFALALYLLLLASVTDSLDGLIARQFDCSSRFGSILDPAVDKIFTTACYISLMQVNIFPVWLTAIVVGRDLVIIGGAFSYHLLYGPYDFQPTTLGKANTFFELVLLVVTLLQLSHWLELQVLLLPLMLLVCGSSILSVGHYVYCAFQQRWTRTV